MNEVQPEPTGAQLLSPVTRHAILDQLRALKPGHNTLTFTLLDQGPNPEALMLQTEELLTVAEMLIAETGISNGLLYVSTVTTETQTFTVSTRSWAFLEGNRHSFVPRDQVVARLGGLRPGQGMTLAIFGEDRQSSAMITLQIALEQAEVDELMVWRPIRNMPVFQISCVKARLDHIKVDELKDELLAMVPGHGILIDFGDAPLGQIAATLKDIVGGTNSGIITPSMLSKPGVIMLSLPDYVCVVEGLVVKMSEVVESFKLITNQPMVVEVPKLFDEYDELMDWAEHLVHLASLRGVWLIAEIDVRRGIFTFSRCSEEEIGVELKDEDDDEADGSTSDPRAAIRRFVEAIIGSNDLMNPILGKIMRGFAEARSTEIGGTASESQPEYDPIASIRIIMDLGNDTEE